MEIPSTDSEVTEVYMNVRRREPVFPGFAYGFLYATHGRARRTVAVPYNYGVSKLRTINDLHVHIWVPNTSPVPHVVDMAVGRQRVTTCPGSLVRLEFAYSVIYVPPTSASECAVNQCSSLRAATEWKGNILVLKHGKRKPVINMEAEDAFLVDTIVSAAPPATPLHSKNNPIDPACFGDASSPSAFG
ncbi:hypothetical protein C8F04DRAFT_1184053 [Mycena alexandri]|uniref:Uncharacterized protein n=1 Tax=Mycena alexandri TaxID=1745969 RepID=A0AAD6STG2_9AGAR|nr:hypothetical protein C8F04DRAFT_1184053 [Mycena alexandri]